MSTTKKHNHKKAFCLMWYACKCGHRERIWNSRDGVTPFCMQCPSCGQPDMHHIAWNADEYAPEHIPHEGQRMWINMTREEALRIAKIRLELSRAMGHERENEEDDLEGRIAESIYNNGDAP